MNRWISFGFGLIFINASYAQKTNQPQQDQKTVEMVTPIPEPTNPEETELWEPKPAIVNTSRASHVPSDAIILFNGTDLNQWVNAKDSSAKANWILNGDGSMTVRKGSGDIMTRQEFGSIQLHLEWRAPSEIKGEGQNRGNSGIFFQNRYEIQVLDNYQNNTYVNGQAGSVYKQHPPLVNACRAPGEWQTYDIIFHEPVFDSSGKKIKSGTFTVLHNGVLIQDHVEIMGTTEYIGWPKNEAHGKGPIKLQDHDCDVSYRNIWVRTL